MQAQQARLLEEAGHRRVIRSSAKHRARSGFLSVFARSACAMLLTLLLADLTLRAAFPTLPRLDANFSSAYLDRSIRSIGRDQHLVMLGDSVLWGYRLPAEQSAASLLRARGVPVINLSFEGGSLPNTYALLRLMESSGVRPKAVLFNVNLKVFNHADSAYNTLYPGVERAAWPLLSPQQHALLHPTQNTTFDARADAFLSRLWAFYGLRNDLRETLFGDVDAANAFKNLVNALSGEAARAQAAHVPTPDKFMGTYDLSPLTDENVELRFLRDTVALLHRDGIRATAILTPANHALLHDYIDCPEYEAQRKAVAEILRAGGVRVLDYDRAFPARDFLDNDHLTAVGNQKLALMLERDALR